MAERRRIEDALRYSEAKFRTLVEQASDGIFISDENGIYTEVNSSGCNLVGYACDEVLGKTIATLVPEDDHPILLANLAQIRSGQAVVFECGMLHKGGGLVDVEISAKRLPDGRIQQIVRDIGARKQAEQQIEALAKFPTENPFPVMRIHSEGHLDYANEASAPILAVWHCRPGDLVPKTYRDTLAAALEDGQVKPLVVENEDRAWELHFAPIPGAGYVNIYGRDITESRRAEERIQQSELRYRRLFESAKDGILIIQAGSGMIVDVNPYLLSLLELPKEEVLGKQLWQLGILSNAHLSQEKFAELQQQEYVRYEDLPLQAADGREINVEFVSNTYLVGSEKVVQCNIRDISDRVKTAREIRKLNADLENRVAERTLQLETANKELQAATLTANSANKAKGDFLASMSHEIRTPMNAIIGFAGLALKTKLAPNQKDYIEKIHRSGLSLLGILNDILDLSKVEAGKLTIESIAFSLEEVLEGVASVTAQHANAKGLEFILNVPQDVPRNLVGDPFRLQQILVNLVGNAVKFTEKGEIELKIDLTNKSPGVELRFSVRDTGIGMSKGQIEKLFEPFSQADLSMSRKYGGTGLGLSISHHLIEMMGGKIEVKSEPGKGSTFSFTASFGRGMESNPFRNRLSGALIGQRILIVEDNFLLGEVLRRSLVSAQFDVDVVDTGEAAIEMAQKSVRTDPYQVVLMDWILPGIDGIETMKRILNNPEVVSPPAFIIVSAWGSGEDERTTALNAGATAFLRKPITSSILMDNLVNILRPKLRQTEDAQPSDAAENHGLDGARVLLVEDNDMNQQIAAELLGDAGMSVDIAENGIEALSKLDEQGNTYDMVLMDIQMPGMDGFEALRRIREQKKFSDLPVIAMTAHARLEDRNKAIAAGMNGYITKPLDPSAMFKTLRRFYKSDASINLSIPSLAVKVDDREIPDMVGIDVESALKRVAGNKSLYINLLHRFVEGQEGTAELIRKALAQEDRTTAERTAHTLKGVSGNIGAQAVQSAAGELERAIARQEDSAQISERIETLERSLREVIQNIQSAVSKNPSTSAPGTRAGIRESVPAGEMIRLRRLLEENDGEAVDCFHSIRDRAAASWRPEDFKKVDQAIQAFNFSKALQVLNTNILRSK